MSRHNLGAAAMRNHLWAALATLATLALVSCGAPSTTDFVKKAADSDLYEVAAGKLASEKGQSEAVKQFGAHMVEAHTKTSEELKGIVASEKLDVKIPAEPDRKRVEMLKALTDAKPEEFDALYIKQQVKAHTKAEKLFDAYAERGDNPALKQFAANTLPVIKQHLKDAQTLQK
jgi:putative membrane protein